MFFFSFFFFPRENSIYAFKNIFAFQWKTEKLTLPQFPKEGILFSKENNVSQTQVHTQSNTVSKSFLWKNANWRDLANPGKVLFRSLKRREGLCKAILCSGKSNLEGRKAAIMAIFKEKKTLNTVFWKYLTTLAMSTTDKKKRATYLAILSQLCQEKQLHWNIFINYHQLCSSGFTNQKWYLQALLSNVIQIIPASHLNNSRHFELINQMR